MRVMEPKGTTRPDRCGRTGALCKWVPDESGAERRIPRRRRAVSGAPHSVSSWSAVLRTPLPPDKPTKCTARSLEPPTSDL